MRDARATLLVAIVLTVLSGCGDGAESQPAVDRSGRSLGGTAVIPTPRPASTEADPGSNSVEPPVCGDDCSGVPPLPDGLGDSLPRGGSIVLGEVTALPGERVPVEIRLESEESVYALEVVLQFDPAVPIGVTDEGTPDCRLNPEFAGPGSGVAFYAEECERAGDCDGVRVVVIALDEKIPGDSLLGSCNFEILDNATAGAHRLSCDGDATGASDDTGRLVLFDCFDGAVHVASSGTPRPTLTPTPQVERPAPPEGATPGAPALEMAEVAGAAGERLFFQVVLRSAGRLVAGVQNDLDFPPGLPVAAKASGRPDCRVNSALGKTGVFGFLPHGCHGIECTGLRAIVFSLSDTVPILDGSLIYTCAIDVPTEISPGTYFLTASNVLGSDPHGTALEIEGLEGAIVVAPKP